MTAAARWDWQPWEYDALATHEERLAQESFQDALTADGRVGLGPGTVVSRFAGLAVDRLTLGARGWIAAHAYVSGEVTTGDDCTINAYAVVRGQITLGTGVRIAAHAQLLGFNHRFDDPEVPIHRQGLLSKGIVVEDDVWIGGGSLILDGVRVGRGAVVGAGAVVRRHVPPGAVVTGDPAQVVRQRGDTFERALQAFGARARAQYPEIIDRAGPLDGRPLCDAVELGAMFGGLPPGADRDAWIGRLRPIRVTAWPPPTDTPGSPHEEVEAYRLISVGHALEALGARLSDVPGANLDGDALCAWLDGLPWATNAWDAGAFVDAHATGRFFAGARPDALFEWLAAHQQAHTGMWGAGRADSGWLYAVNGLYRLARGSYALFGRPLPRPEAVIDTVLSHIRHNHGFVDEQATVGLHVCHLLDAVHPLWLAGRQTGWRRDEARAAAKGVAQALMARWIDGQGLPTGPGEGPSLQGTEMGLAIVYTAAAVHGLEGALGYTPRGVHALRPLTG